MAPVLEDLLSDSRLARLFAKDERPCALQLWVLQIKSAQSIENRVLYGRLLPYNHSSNSWSSSDDDNFRHFGHVEAQVIRLNLYVKSIHCAEILRQLSAGRTIAAISKHFKLGLSGKFKARFGAASLPADILVYRPVAYLLNLNAYDRSSPSSPHGEAGALSASISQSRKVALFRLNKNYDAALTKSVIEHLNADTGLDFGGADAARFGDLELMVFPALDDQERSLLSVSWTDAPLALVARFNPMQVPNFAAFQFRLSITNGDQIAYSGIAVAERNAEEVFQCQFVLSDHLHSSTDSAELEIFGFDDDHSRQGTLCSRWKARYIREVHLQGHVSGYATKPIKFDWLEKTTRPAASERVNAALTINRDDLGFNNSIGGRAADPWVPANRDLASLFARLHPPRSEGRFFSRWGHDGEGRLQFVEWFKPLLAKYHQHQMVIFDPYFESAGLDLMLLCVAPKADYVVFRSLQKPSKADEAKQPASDNLPQSGIDTLLANCEHNRNLLKHIKLRIFGLKEGRLHDRYILIMAPNGLPVAGFNLSNSFQKAAENYPLLVTPIPADVLLKVEDYKSGLVREAQAVQGTGETENPSIQLLFDSTGSPTAPRLYEPLRFLNMAEAGDVLSNWTGEASLQSLSGEPLKAQMATLGLLKGDALALLGPAGLRNCLDQQTSDFAGFTRAWAVIGELLAHSHAGDHEHRDLESECGLLKFLAQFLEVSFNRAYDGADKELAVMGARILRKPIEILLHSSYHPDHLFHATKYEALTWPEFFSIKFLWRYAPEALLVIAEAQMASVPIEPQAPDAVRLSLLSQIIGEISLSVQYGISDVQRERLMRSSNGLLQWLGLNAIERRLEKTGGLAGVLQLVATFPYDEQVRTLGWMINRAAGNAETDETYRGLVAALHQALPATIPESDLLSLVNSMRGHMHQLAWAEPWLFQDLVYPLLQNDSVNIDDACKIWVHELTTMLKSEIRHQTPLFNRAREGQTTNITACLFAHGSPERQQASLKSLKAILKYQQRTVQQPLASTSNWMRWDGALTIAMWILAFTRWAQYYLRGRGMTVGELDELSRKASELAMVRSMKEWRLMGAGERGELAAFLDQVTKLLADNHPPAQAADNASA